VSTSILWNGFEIKRGVINTSAGNVPYLCYSPEISTEVVNIAIHGEGHNKEDWLCFNSVLKLGNLLKESIKHNSPFIAFDIYGHGEWIIDDKNFNTTSLSEDDISDLIKESIKGIQEAIPIILKEESLKDNPLALTSLSLGCSIALGLNISSPEYKSILISPSKADVSSNCKNYFIIKSKNDPDISDTDLHNMFKELPPRSILESHNSNYKIPIKWINKTKKIIYPGLE